MINCSFFPARLSVVARPFQLAPDRFFAALHQPAHGVDASALNEVLVIHSVLEVKLKLVPVRLVARRVKSAVEGVGVCNTTTTTTATLAIRRDRRVVSISGTAIHKSSHVI